MVRLLEVTRIRVGNEEYARDNASYGLTTLRERQVRVRGGKVNFRFRGKSGVQHDIELTDRRLARIVRRMQDLPGQELFCYVDEAGVTRRVESADVNAYLRAVTLIALGPPRSATDARRKIVAAIDAAAARLNNTRAVCRASYVSPRVPDAYAEGSLMPAVARAQERERFSRSEATLVQVLG